MATTKVIFKKTAKNMAYWPGDIAELPAEVAVRLVEEGAAELVDGAETATSKKAETAVKTAAGKKAK